MSLKLVGISALFLLLLGFSLGAKNQKSPKAKSILTPIPLSSMQVLSNPQPLSPETQSVIVPQLSNRLSSATDTAMLQTAITASYQSSMPRTIQGNELDIRFDELLYNKEWHGKYASGNVGRINAGGGEKWFAQKKGNTWIILWIGQGPPTCKTIAGYNLPKELLSCVN